MANKVVHFEVTGRDGAKLQQFYGELFDWKVDADNPMDYGVVSADDAGIGGGISSMPGAEGRVTFYVGVPDINAHLEKVESLGGSTIMPREEMEMVTFALFADPEGHVIGLVEA